MMRIYVCCHSPPQAMGITAVFNVSGVDKKKFERHIQGGHAATYLDWSRTWNQGVHRGRWRR